MKRFDRAFALFALAICFSGCGRPSAPNPADIPPAQNSGAGSNPSKRPSATDQSAKLRATWKSDPTPNRFQVELEWNVVPSVESDAWVLVREDKEKGRHPLVTLPLETNHFTDRGVSAGRTYGYWLTHPASSEGKTNLVRDQVSVSVPRDEEVTGPRLGAQWTQLNRLFLRRGSVLTTEGRPLRIHVEELLSEGARIETFLASESSAPGADGRSPGDWFIHAERASGQLLLHLFGENGGAGQRGALGAGGAMGRAGSPGRIGQKGEVRPFEIFGPNIHATLFCAEPPGAGGRGEKGGAGGVGQSGGRGSHSPRTLIWIENPSGFTVTPEKRAGLGGAAGPGGFGGAGGPGGHPGVNPDSRLCPDASWGATGEPGMDGAPGAAGPNGSLQPVCLRLGSANFGECDSFPNTLEGF